MNERTFALLFTITSPITMAPTVLDAGGHVWCGGVERFALSDSVEAASHVHLCDEFAAR